MTPVEWLQLVATAFSLMSSIWVNRRSSSSLLRPEACLPQCVWLESAQFPKSLCWADEWDAIACLCCISLSSSWMSDHFLYQQQKAKLAPQSSFWALCNWKWLNSLTVEHQRWKASLSGLVFPPPYFIYGQFGNLGLAHLFLALFMLISLFTLIAPAEVPEPLMDQATAHSLVISGICYLCCTVLFNPLHFYKFLLIIFYIYSIIIMLWPY